MTAKLRTPAKAGHPFDPIEDTLVHRLAQQAVQRGATLPSPSPCSCPHGAKPMPAARPAFPLRRLVSLGARSE
ncbi:hypothetical protein [Antarctobacter jejuensis]|uniref:hypothetical protein n=1 Tax=Antarctobacter jejuensis TaxID=1439938 RepID=UPI003FD4FE4D